MHPKALLDACADLLRQVLRFERLGRRVPFDAPAGSLREEERATVAIARALQDATPGHGLIIFDESTRALGRRSLEHFFQILDEIVATGTSILLITHRLEEIVDAADRVTILRDGRVVESGREVAGRATIRPCPTTRRLRGMARTRTARRQAATRPRHRLRRAKSHRHSRWRSPPSSCAASSSSPSR